LTPGLVASPYPGCPGRTVSVFKAIVCGDGNLPVLGNGNGTGIFERNSVDFRQAGNLAPLAIICRVFFTTRSAKHEDHSRDDQSYNRRTHDSVLFLLCTV